MNKIQMLFRTGNSLAFLSELDFDKVQGALKNPGPDGVVIFKGAEIMGGNVVPDVVMIQVDARGVESFYVSPFEMPSKAGLVAPSQIRMVSRGGEGN